MSQLFDYIFDIEAVPDDDRTADGLCAVLLNVRGTGTCGVATPGNTPCDGPVPGDEDQSGYVPMGDGCTGIVFPGMEAAGQATVGTAADVSLPLPWCHALGPWWFPGAGEALLPSLGISGVARTLVLSASALPPLFALARAAGLVSGILPRPEGLGQAGAAGNAVLPPDWAALSASGLATSGEALVRAPLPHVEAYHCGLDNPVVRRTPQADVVRLLNANSAVLAALAAALTRGLDDPDDKAAALLYTVSNLLTYVSDSQSLDFDDNWSCGVATWFRGQGDCEDGAILLHGLLLACQTASSRVVTIFGRVGSDNRGHAWLCYKRAADERWTVLDWTAGARSPLAGPDDFPTLEQSPDYHSVEYALTGERFHAARMSVADFFPSLRAGVAWPPAVCAAETGLTARGALRIGPALSLPELPGPLSCRAVDGGGGSGTLPGLAAVARAGWRTGSATFPALCGIGLAGAKALAALAGVAVTAACGALASGRCPLAALRGRGEAASAALCAGRCRLLRLNLRGKGVGGEIGGGCIALPVASARAAGASGTLGDCLLAMPGTTVAAFAWFDARGGGAAACGPLAAEGRGVAVVGGLGGVVLAFRDKGVR
ncbi:hypothetical protein ASZ90_000149 [hydrocarbon metagenome]|uniref:Transglutaminase-like domain-containing protein n=1 Tax=hydrocarbon metagenome TaxID=938273 RepID=A0A0W8GA13_9ZZZZ